MERSKAYRQTKAYRIQHHQINFKTNNGTSLGGKHKRKKKTYDLLKTNPRDFPSGSVVKTSYFNTKCAGLIPGHGDKIPHDLWPKKAKHKTEVIL